MKEIEKAQAYYNQFEKILNIWKSKLEHVPVTDKFAEFFDDRIIETDLFDKKVTMTTLFSANHKEIQKEFTPESPESPSSASVFSPPLSPPPPPPPPPPSPSSPLRITPSSSPIRRLPPSLLPSPSSLPPPPQPPPPLPPPPPSPPQPIVLLQRCPETHREFTDLLIQLLKELLEGLPDKSWKNRMKRFFSRSTRISDSDLTLWDEDKANLNEKINRIIETEKQKTHHTSFSSIVSEDLYHRKYNMYCKSYKILKYIVENQESISIENRIEFLTLLTNLMETIPAQTDLLLPEEIPVILLVSLRAYFDLFLSNQTQPEKIRRERSQTFQDIKRLFGNNLSRGKPLRKHRVTKRTLPKSRTRKKRRKE